ncbi:MAG: 6-carboxytetrahydropterin synthase [Candidatus Heimdallarchaeota archaeon]|nr:6-carboxytetrahydropterin synthase [Candidatus Heimdallarchaeota archaeon]
MKEVTIYKSLQISSSHQLTLPYESKCNRLHGHNFEIEAWVTGSVDEFGMVVDFHKIKEIAQKLDHQHLNDLIEFPTAENIAIHIAKEIWQLRSNGISQIKVRVWETKTAYAESELVNSG